MVSRKQIAIIVVIASAIISALYIIHKEKYTSIDVPQTKSGPKPAYATETWRKSREFVWANPGSSGGLFILSNWLENGATPTELMDENTDVILPPATNKYIVVATDEDEKNGMPQWISFRHITLNSNAQFAIMANIKAYGNIWIKPGAKFEIFNILTLAGDKNTFFRNDKVSDMDKDLGYFTTRGMAQHVKVTKRNNASVELIGRMVFKDEFSVYSGKLICGPGSEIFPGGPSVQDVFEGATLEIQSGAMFGKKLNQYKNNDIRIAGTLQAGSPERPLTSDAYIGLSQGKNISNRRDAAEKVYGLILEETGSIKVYSDDPTRARLNFTWHGMHPKLKRPTLDTIEKSLLGIEILLKGNIDLNGILFDHVRKGGINLSNPSCRSRWSNIYYGENNHAEADELFSEEP